MAGLAAGLYVVGPPNSFSGHGLPLTSAARADFRFSPWHPAKSGSGNFNGQTFPSPVCGDRRRSSLPESLGFLRFPRYWLSSKVVGHAGAKPALLRHGAALKARSLTDARANAPRSAMEEGGDERIFAASYRQVDRRGRLG